MLGSWRLESSTGRRAMWTFSHSASAASWSRLSRFHASWYREHVEEIIGRKDKRSYEEAVRLMDRTIRPLFAESGRSVDFPRYVDEVRAAHKPKRNLMKLIDRLDAPIPPGR